MTVMRFSPRRPVLPMTLSGARRTLKDLDFAMTLDPDTRAMAWLLIHAARKGQALDVTLITFTPAAPQPEPPKDAA
jgi:hypothetical protein